jgi:Flp pilus assembly pilin Flp
VSIATLRRQIYGQGGASSAEYALLIALIAGVIVIAVIFFGQSVKARYTSAGSCMDNTQNC